MSPTRRKKMRSVVKRMAALRKRMERKVDPEAKAFNRRVRRVNWIVRQYRGELIYALLLTGNPDLLETLVSTVGRLVREQDRAAFDILSFVYLAAFDGVLSVYPEDRLARVGRGLEKIARSAEGYRVYRNGELELPSWAPRRRRNFADYAFHLIAMLQRGEVATDEPPEPPPPPKKKGSEEKVTPRMLTIGRIRDAVDRGLRALDRLQPTYTFRPEAALALRGRHGSLPKQHPKHQRIVHEMGNNAPPCWP